MVQRWPRYVESILVQQEKELLVHLPTLDRTMAGLGRKRHLEMKGCGLHQGRRNLEKLVGVGVSESDLGSLTTHALLESFEMNSWSVDA